MVVALSKGEEGGCRDEFQGPNHLWHVDTNHKLIRWNLIIGGIDGFSRFPVMLKCSNNNQADIVLACFVDAVNEYGLPSTVRTGRGLENVGITQFMIQNKRHKPRKYISRKERPQPAGRAVMERRL